MKLDLFKREYADLFEMAKAEGLLFSKNTQVFPMRLDGEVAGCCGLLISKGSAVFKCDYVMPKYRGNKLLETMIRIRLGHLRKNYPEITKVTANCTHMALRSHLRKGAYIKEQFKNGIVKVQYDI